MTLKYPETEIKTGSYSTPKPMDYSLIYFDLPTSRKEIMI